MKKRKLRINCEHDVCQKLADCIAAYAHAAFPVGGSPCSQATRESLLDFAQRLKSNTEPQFSVNPRQRPMLKSAINWYYQEVENDPKTQELLLKQIQRP